MTPRREPSGAEDRSIDASGMSRRRFLRGTGLVAASAAVAACTPPGLRQLPVRPRPSPPVAGDDLTFFDADQAAIVEAMAERIFPADDLGPGATDAGVVYYIDRLLAGGDGWAIEPIYRQGPFADTYTGDEPPDDDERTVWILEDEMERYGWQNPLTPTQAYRVALEAVEEHARATAGSGFADLDDGAADQILEALSNDELDGFDDITGEAFFDLFREHVMQGVFADPRYGGNRDLVGWTLVGYPSSQRAYTPQEMRAEGTEREPKALHDLSPFHPGHADHARAEVPVVTPHPRMAGR